MAPVFTLLSGAALALACCGSATAQQRAPMQETVHFATFENDMYFDTDRYYTNGIQLSAKHSADRRGRMARAFTDQLCRWVGCEGGRLLSSRSNLGQLIYTPGDINVRAHSAR